MFSIKVNNVTSVAGLFMILFLIKTIVPAFSQQGDEPNSEEKGPLDQNARELLLRLQREIGEIQNNQIEYVAQEEQLQEEYNNKGKMVKQRKMQSNYYRIRLGGVESHVECREVIRVDGKPTGERRKLEELFLSESKSLEKKIREVMKQNRKYYLGWKSRQTNQPFVGLVFSMPHRQEYATYHTELDETGNDRVDRLYFRENPEAALFRNTGFLSSEPTPARGEYLFDEENGQFFGYDISLYRKSGNVEIRIAARYNRMKDGKLLPVRFEEYAYHKNGKIKTRSVSEYSNYRRFTVKAKILSYESVE